MNKRMSIQEASDRLGLPKSTLRYWEKELADHIQPVRTQGGQRRYETHHIKVFEHIRKMKNNGLTLGQIKRALAHTCEHQRKMDMRYASIDSVAQRIADLVRQELRHFICSDKLL
jgi:DNA-binding transcriptional MerR regulator